MSIQSVVGNIQHKVGETIDSTLGTARTTWENIVGGVTTGFTNLWSGGFVGMSEGEIGNLKTALQTYCDEIQGIIDGFDQRGDITDAYKGEIQNAAYEFIAAVKELLKAYVAQMKKELSEIDEAYANFQASSQSVAQNVTSDAEQIRSNAQQMNTFE